MAEHFEIRPDNSSLALKLASKALRVANGLSTARPGSLYIPNEDGTGTLIGPAAGTDPTGGANGVAPWVGDTTPPGKPTGITCSSAWGTLYVNWDGTLEGGVPADFAYVSVLVDGTEIARMVEAGTAVREDLENGATVQVTAVAYDAARDRNGNPAPNASEAFGPVSVQISDERADIDAEVEVIKGEMEQAAQDAADAKEAAAEASSKADAAADKADSYQSQIDDVTATVNGLEQEVAGFSSQIQGAVEDASQALTAATEASQDLEGFKTTVSQTYETKADADAAMAQEVLDRNSAIEQSAGEILSTVSQNYVDNETGETLATKAEVSQTASQIKQEVSEEYQVKGDYLTEDEAASSYASKSELTQTADSIKAEVAQDYQTKAGMSAYATNSSVEQTASEIESNVAANYQTKADMSSYATNSSVTQTASQIKQEVAAEYQTKGDYATNSEVAATYATKTSLQQTEDSILSSVESEYQSKDGMSSYATKSYVDQQDNSIKSTVSSVQTTANNALSKASTVEQTADGLEVRLTQAEKDVDTANSTANSAKSTASTASTNATNALNRVTVKDTRNDNQNPQWYMTNYPKQQVQEFKYCSKIGLSGVGTYCYLTTYVPWIDNSGGYPKQTAKVDSTGKEYWRSGTSNTAWSAWVDAYGTASTANSAANTANTTANAAKTAAATAQTTATNAAKTATNYLKFDSAGLCVGNQTTTLGYNTLIKSTGVDIRNGSTVLSSFGASQIELGRNSSSSKISFCGGKGEISYKSKTAAGVSSNMFTIESDSKIYIGDGSTKVYMNGYTVPQGIMQSASGLGGGTWTTFKVGNGASVAFGIAKMAFGSGSDISVGQLLCTLPRPFNTYAVNATLRNDSIVQGYDGAWDVNVLVRYISSTQFMLQVMRGDNAFIPPGAIYNIGVIVFGFTSNDY